MSAEATLHSTVATLDGAPRAMWRDEQLRCALLLMWTHSLTTAALPPHLTSQMLRHLAGGAHPEDTQ